MIDTSIDTLLKKVDSKYTLVVLAAKRARQITEGASKTIESKSNKPVTVALQEIGKEKISFERLKPLLK